jgi:hypothetical protein
VFVSSLSGRVAKPLMGPYSASKFALEGMADALRMELAPWGIQVILIEPAQTDTDLWRHAEEELDASVAAIENALTNRRPRTRYVVGRGARAQALLAQLTPTPVLDRLTDAWPSRAAPLWWRAPSTRERSHRGIRLGTLISNSAGRSIGAQPTNCSPPSML